jgi:hypothetical protein
MQLITLHSSKAADAFPVNRIFGFAADSFDRALGAVTSRYDGALPTAEAVDTARYDASRGAELLSAANVPSSSYIDRQRSIAAASHARVAADQLAHFLLQSDAAAPAETLSATLAAARDELVLARSIIR